MHAVHAVQRVAPALSENMPAGQGMQSSMLSLPVEGRNVPCHETSMFHSFWKQ